MLNSFLLNGIILLSVYLFIMLIIVQIKHDTSIANFTWGGGTLLVTLYTIFALKNYLSRPILITILIFLWATRLIIFLYIRYTGKDPRFEKWKLKGTKALLINILWIFLGQLALLIIMSIPSYLVNTNMLQPSLGFLDLFGLIIWVLGFLFESISDYQLFIFLKNPSNKGHVLQSGLWRYSRHPNYFGEALMWWGIFFIAVNVQYGFLAIISALTITFLLRFVTGVPMLENAMKENPEYQEYKKHTNIFFPYITK